MEAKDYHPMWKDLGLNLEAHDQLLNVLGQAYKDIYMTQENRPKGMQYLDFVISEAHGLRIEELMETKKKGNKVIGTFCVYVPEELILAVGGTCVGLCAGAEIGIDEAEKVLPRNTCALIKSFMGFKLAGLCPYIQASDLVVGETTCDGKKKMFELLAEFRPIHILQLPQTQGSDGALSFWYHEVKKFKERMEKETGVQITDEKLSNAINLTNEERKAKKALMDLAKTKPSSISGIEILTILFKTGFFMDKRKGIGSMYELIEEFQTRIDQGESPFTPDTPRILFTGVPVGLGSEKVVRLIEKAGANVVCFENCSGYKSVFKTIDEEKEPLQAIAEKYLATPCSVMSPNPGRYELLAELIEGFSVDGVVNLTWRACHTYNVESYSIGRFVEEKFQLPFLHLETDYSESDTEQLRVRIEAFLEMVKN
ncbi:MAG: double-cubane-cluster-containing anaerobic reductase [Thermodesulfobacteriota bacterium]